ncbi:MAG: hypothetical protein ACKN9T_15275 [Candidatus Methylumidiphilus sp.]
MKKISNGLISDELKQALGERLNRQKMFMNPRTGTVQSLELWRIENSAESPEPFDAKELVEVKLANDQWVRVN